MDTQNEEQDYLWKALDDIFPTRLVVDLNEQLADLERSSIVNALDACEQNQTKAAKMLSVGLLFLAVCQTYSYAAPFPQGKNKKKF